MNLSDMTQDQLDKITAKLKAAEEIAAERDRLLEDIKKVSAVGIDPEQQQAAQFRLLKTSGLYSDAQITEMIANAQGGSGESDSSEDAELEALYKMLEEEESAQGGSTNEELEQLRAQVDQLTKKDISRARNQLISYMGRKVDSTFPEMMKKKLKEAAEANGKVYTEPTEEELRFWSEDAKARLASEAQILMKHNGGRIPTLDQIDELAGKVVPQRLEQVQSVIANPSRMASAETVSGSSGEFDLPEEKVEAPKLLDIVEGKVSDDEATRQQDAARIDALTRAAADATAEKGQDKSVV